MVDSPSSATTPEARLGLPGTVALFLLSVGVALALLVLPGDRLMRPYAGALVASANFCIELTGFEENAIIIRRRANSKKTREVDVDAWFGPVNPKTGVLRKPDNAASRSPSSRSWGVLLDSRHVGYTPMALVLALCLATPLRLRQRMRMVWRAFLLVHLYIAVVVAAIFCEPVNAFAEFLVAMLKGYPMNTLTPLAIWYLLARQWIHAQVFDIARTAAAPTSDSNSAI